MEDLIGYISNYEIGNKERLQWNDLFAAVTKLFSLRSSCSKARQCCLL